MKRLLLIDDDLNLLSLLSQFLVENQFKVDNTDNGEAGLQKALDGNYDLILLDTNMPRMSGFEVIELLRQKSNVLVLMFTEQGDDVNQILRLGIGADNYLTKPFSERELLTAIRDIFRHSQDDPDTKNKMSHLDIDLFSTQQVHCQGLIISLTNSEFLLLKEFMLHPGIIYSKKELSERILGKLLLGEDRSIDMHLSNLRRKLPPRSDAQKRVKKIRGDGYVWLE
ncbi:MAG: response regulator transcription factor [Psychromonas sp.]